MKYGLVVFVVFICGVACAADVVCPWGSLDCYGRCVSTYGGDECMHAHEGKCLQCRHWNLVEGVCQWNCSDFTEHCIYCSNSSCLSCEDNRPISRSGGKCLTCQSGEVYYDGRCISICSSYRYRSECLSSSLSCFWDSESLSCRNCLNTSDSPFFQDYENCESCGYYFDDVMNCTSTCAKYSSYYDDYPDSCERCGYYHDGSHCWKKEPKCDCSKRAETLPDCCDECGFGWSEWNLTLKREACLPKCSGYKKFLRSEFCENCYYYGVSWYQGKCRKCSVFDKNAIFCTANDIDECKEGFEPVRDNYDDQHFRCYKAPEPNNPNCAHGMGSTLCFRCTNGERPPNFEQGCHSCPPLSK